MNFNISKLVFWELCFSPFRVSSSKSTFSSEGSGPAAGTWAMTNNIAKRNFTFLFKNFEHGLHSSVETNWFCIIMLHYWPKKIAPLFHPITSETKTSLYLVPHAFPRFASAACVYFEFWLVPWIVCVLCDWPEWLLWFWFYDNWICSIA